MKKTQRTRLSVRSETLRTLADHQLAIAVGGMFNQSNNACPPQPGDSAGGSCPCGGSDECYSAMCTV